MQVFLTQAIVAAGGVEDVGLELGADEVVAGKWHGASRGGIRSHNAHLSTRKVRIDRDHW